MANGVLDWCDRVAKTIRNVNQVAGIHNPISRKRWAKRANGSVCQTRAINRETNNIPNKGMIIKIRNKAGEGVRDLFDIEPSNRT